MKKDIEFSQVRSILYKEALQEFPFAREKDLNVMKEFLNPQKTDYILEVGAGTGFFSSLIASQCAHLTVSDPSNEQLESIKLLNKNNIDIILQVDDHIDLQLDTFNKVWSFGAMHHSFNKTSILKDIYSCLEPQGQAVIVDVFSGTSLAKHFDKYVARFCSVGHEVAFWTEDFAESLSYLCGFKQVTFHHLNDHQWKFTKREDIGKFIYKLHAMIGTTESECLIGCDEILGIEERGGCFYLNWPLTVMIFQK
jgi:arsenite methyltransferase